VSDCAETDVPDFCIQIAPISSPPARILRHDMDRSGTNSEDLSAHPWGDLSVAAAVAVFRH
jgi:hypothetical protein